MNSRESALSPVEELAISSDQLVSTPYRYSLINTALDDEKTADDVVFYVLGCAGNGTEQQKRVARLMHETALNEKVKPAFVILLGDNFYECGVNRPLDPIFKTNFYDIYHHPDLPQIKDVPFFAIPGNHDHDVHNHPMDHVQRHLPFPGIIKHIPWGVGSYLTTRREINFNKITAQIRHTFLSAATEQMDAEKNALYAGEVLDLAHLQAWNMPRRYGVLRPANSQIEIYMIDSTFYAKDYLASLGQECADPNNQAKWLAREAEKYPDALKIVCLHHPLHDRVSKRIDYPDTDLYLSEEELRQFAQKGFKEKNYNKLLLEILTVQGLKFDTVFSAHNHSLSYSALNGMYQVVSGGGGGELQYRSSYEEYNTVSAFMERRGFVKVTVQGKKLTFDFYTTDGPHLKFTNQSLEPLRMKSEEDASLQLLREIVMTACEEYLQFHTMNKSYRHRLLGLFVTDDLKNYFNQFETYTYADAANFVITALTRITHPDEHSLVSYINRTMERECDVSYELFAKNPAVLAASNLLHSSLDLHRAQSETFLATYGLFASDEPEIVRRPSSCELDDTEANQKMSVHQK